MIEIPGIGVLCEGFIERDPLLDTYQIRSLDSSGRQEVVPLAELFAKYSGREVRFTIAFADALRAKIGEVQVKGMAQAAVSFEELAEETRER